MKNSFNQRTISANKIKTVHIYIILHKQKEHNKKQKIVKMKN